MNWLQKLIAKFRRKPIVASSVPAAVPKRLTPVSSVASNVQYKQAVRSHLNVSARPKPKYVPPQPAPIGNITREYRTETRVESSSDVDLLTPLVVAYMMQSQTSPSYSCPAPEPEKFSSGGGGDYGGGGASGSWDSGSSSSDSGSSNDNY